jgi:Cof subfamily protein (haloacid dehalogenase superfamily)
VNWIEALDCSGVRLVATDLDGTLLRSDETVSVRSRNALAELQAAGIEVVFIPARPPRWMTPIAAMTGHHGIAICANGAITYDMAAEHIVDSRPLPNEAAFEIVKRLREVVPGGTFAIETVEGFACEPGHLQDEWESDPPLADAFVLLESPAVKLMFGHPDWTADQLLAAALESVGEMAEVTHSNPSRSAIEISARGVSKATTLASRCSSRGIESAQVIAFGDMPNDLPMLAWAGTAVAVANAHSDVLAAVPNVTASNDDDGVAKVLERLTAALLAGRPEPDSWRVIEEFRLGQQGGELGGTDDLDLQAVCEADLAFLAEMALLAAFPPGPLPDGAREMPHVVRWTQNWGRSGDAGLVAWRSGKRVGAAWCRIQDEVLVRDGAGKPLPEIAIAVVPEERSNGVGTSLLAALGSEATKAGHPILSLTVNALNPAHRLYEGSGLPQSVATATA